VAATVHAPSLRVGWPASGEPAPLVLEALAAYRLAPRLVHSTSWTGRLESYEPEPFRAL
jgi:hypothetical protein